MALPTSGKYIVPLLIVALVYTGYGFRVRDANQATVPGESAEIVRGGCHSPSGKCPEKTSSWTPPSPARLRFETSSAKGRIAKTEKPPADLEESAVNRKLRKLPLKSWTFSAKDRLKKEAENRESLSDEDDEKSESEDFKDEDDDQDDASKGDSDEIVKIEDEEDEEIDSEDEEAESQSGEDDEKEEEERREEALRKAEEEQEKRRAELKKKKEDEEKQRKREEELKHQKEKEERERKEKEETRRKKEEEERKQREEKERKQKEEEERRRKEEEERRRKAEEERKRKEEEERKRKEEAERRLKEEVEKRQREERERRQREEEARRRKEEEDRKQKEAEEKKRKEEEEQRQKEEDRKKAEEEERQRKEEERQRREDERKRKEEEEQRIQKEKEIEEQRKAKEEEAEEKRKLKEKEEEDERRRKKEKEREDKSEYSESKYTYRGTEKKNIDDDDDQSGEVIVKPLSLPRKLEKVRLADKEKHMSLEVIREKSEVQKQYAKKLEVKAPLGETNEHTKSSMTKIREFKPTESTSKLSRVRIDEPHLSKVDKSTAKPTREKTKNEASKGDTKTKASKPRSEKSAEASLSLTELNDAILSVPTFVPNFTAVENGACQQHGKIFLRQLRGYKLWALQMLDSSAKIPSSLLRGNVNQLGDFDQCLGVTARVKIEEKTIKIQGKYCLATVDIHATKHDMKVPVNLMQSRAFVRANMRDPGHFAPRFTTINWALCLPAACSADDAQKAFENALQIYNMSSGIRFNVDVDSDMCYVKQRTQSYSKETIGVLYFYAMMVCLVLVATFRDYFATVQENGNYSERIIMAFSLKRTLKALFTDRINVGDIGCIHGIRSISTAALYIAHKLIPVSRMPYANRVTITEIANNPVSLVFRSSLFYTDSFLMLSGVLTAYNMAKELTVRGEIRWFCRFIARFIRLSPALLAIIFWYAFVMEHTGSGPQWNTVIKANSDICKANAWINLLYVQNFFPFEEMCATHTHQLALDMQLSILAPILVFFIQVKPVIGIIIAFFLLQVSATLRYLATTGNNLSLVVFHGMSLKHLYKTANMTYILPLHRATPYLFGIGLGVILHHTGKNVKLHKIFVIIGWLTSAALAGWSIFSPWRLARRDYIYNVEDATQYAVISPVSSALALSWVIFACFTNNGGIVNKFLSSYWMVVFSKISYAVYLSQFAVFFYNVGTARYSSEFQIHRAIDPFEVAAVIVVSIVMTLLFDIPMQEFKNILMESSDISHAQGTTTAEKELLDEDDHYNRTKDTDHSFANGITPESDTSTGNWNWDRGSFTRGSRNDPREYEYDEALRSSKINRQDPRHPSFIRSDIYDNWDRSKYSRSREQDNQRTGLRSRSAQRMMSDDKHEEQFLQRPRYAASEYSRSPMRELDPVRHRSASRERPITREKDQVPSWEYSGRDRSLSRPPENKPPLLIVSNEEDQITRSPRASSMSRFTDHPKTVTPDTEVDNFYSRTKIYDKRPRVEPRVSDEDDWEDELRIRRRVIDDKYTSQERERVPIGEENKEWDSLRRRSSAEGKIALLREPVTARNMEFWTVSKMQLGSSQEPDDDEDEDSYHRQRREFREHGAPFRDEPGIEEEQGGNSYASESIPTSFDDDEEDDLDNFDFVLRKESKRITIQDLSKIDQEDDVANKSDNISSEERDQVEMSGLPASSGLIKRESMIKSQASEEDPEYLLPERPKLVEQEQEHPFKKAWQIQKSRSEEDGTPVFIVKETKLPDKKKDTDDLDKKVSESGQAQTIDNPKNDRDDPKSSAKSTEGDDKSRLNWPESEQISRHLEEQKAEKASWGLGDGET